MASAGELGSPVQLSQPKLPGWLPESMSISSSCGLAFSTLLRCSVMGYRLQNACWLCWADGEEEARVVCRVVPAMAVPDVELNRTTKTKRMAIPSNRIRLLRRIKTIVFLAYSRAKTNVRSDSALRRNLNAVVCGRSANHIPMNQVGIGVATADMDTVAVIP